MPVTPVVLPPPVFACFEAEETESSVVLRMKSGPLHGADTEGYRSLQNDMQAVSRFYRQKCIVVDFSALPDLLADAFGIFDRPRHSGRDVILSGLTVDLAEKVNLAGFTPFRIVRSVEEALDL